MLTTHARDLEGGLVTAARAVNATATMGLTDQEIADYLRVTATLIRNLEMAGEDPERPARRRGNPGNPAAT